MAAPRNHVPVSAPAAQVYWPAAYGHPSCVVVNVGGSNIYVNNNGAGASGLLLQPNDEVSFSHAVFPIYAVAANVTLGTAIATAAVASAGATAFTLASTGAAFGTGSTVALGGSTTTEYLTIATIVTTAITTTSATVFDHASGVNMSLVSAVAGSSARVHALTG